VREWRRDGAGAFLVGVAPTGLQFAGMTKTQTVRVLGFALIVIGAALFLAAHRRHHCDLSRYHRSRRDQNRPAGYDWSRHAPSRPARYDWSRHAPSWPARYDWSRHVPSQLARSHHDPTYHDWRYPDRTYPDRTYHVQPYHDHIRREQSTRGPSWRDESRRDQSRRDDSRDGLPELIHRPEKPDLRNWISRA
jgi:hypothetical protein